MSIWVAIMSIWAALSGGLPWGIIFDSLPLAARNLPPTAVTCQFLPRCDSDSSCAARRSAFQKNGAWTGGQPMSLVGLKLWHSVISMQIEKRSIASDLFMKNDVEGLEYPATACHIVTGAGGRGQREDLRWGRRDRDLRRADAARQCYTAEVFNGAWVFEDCFFPWKRLLSHSLSNGNACSRRLQSPLHFA